MARPHSVRRQRRGWRIQAFNTVWMVGGLLGVWSCAGANGASGTGDPLEGVNRVTYKFNDVLDKTILEPVAEGYTKITPESVQRGISNFFDNLQYVNVILNNVLQGKFIDGLADFWRLFFNTTLGFGGFFDVATPQGLVEHEEDFGQTLGVWGFGEGFYLVLPLFGPSTLRDAPGIAVEAVTNPLWYIDDLRITLPVRAVDLVDTRARLLDATRARDEAAVDPYIFTREAYLQRRTYLIYDGNPPEPDYLDELEDLDFEEDPNEEEEL